ncbi:hypothetical protein [Streptosporangium jomthongense]|uniref:Uncharacterized protein n=1 Tax=Streptosporangium jomthongense TaxID=1193683 RepID=A0ABV8EX86_9ACTN
MATPVTYRTKGGATVTWTPASALTIPVGVKGRYVQQITASKWSCRGCGAYEGGEATQVSGSGSTKWDPTGPGQSEAARHANQCTWR